jgi:hypothetical protein
MDCSKKNRPWTLLIVSSFPILPGWHPQSSRPGAGQLRQAVIFFGQIHPLTASSVQHRSQYDFIVAATIAPIRRYRSSETPRASRLASGNVIRSLTFGISGKGQAFRRVWSGPGGNFSAVGSMETGNVPTRRRRQSETFARAVQSSGEVRRVEPVGRPRLWLFCRSITKPMISATTCQCSTGTIWSTSMMS